MIDQIIQYLPQAMVTITAVAVPMVPAFIMKAVSDKKAITTFEDIKATAESLKQKEINISENVAKMNNLAETINSKVDRIESDIECKMQDVSSSVLGFQQDEIYQKMLNGLSQLDEMQNTMKLKDELIEKQAQTIKEIHKRLGELK